MEQWRLHTALALLAGFRSEVHRLKDLMGKRADSIWTMNKSELIDVAVKELSMPHQQASEETVTSLRERIRRARAGTRQIEEDANPLNKLPAKLDRLLHQELVEECTKRGIPVLDPLKKDKTKTRPQMIVDIRDDVEVRKSSACPKATPAPARTRGVSRPRPRGETDSAGDFHMVDPSTVGQAAPSSR